jgi:hypothetical protein
MANPHKGEVEFTLDKKVYTLCFTTNSLCELEDKLGVSILQRNEVKANLKHTRSFFWAALIEHQQGVTEEEAGKLMDRLGLKEAVELANKAFVLTFPVAEGNGPLAEPRPKSTGKGS